MICQKMELPISARTTGLLAPSCTPMFNDCLMLDVSKAAAIFSPVRLESPMA